MTRAASLFELAKCIVQEHQSGPAEKLRVVPVVVDVLDDVLNVVGALATLCEGCLLSAHDLSLADPVDATQNPLRLNAVKTALGGEGLHEVRISESGGRVDASFPNIPDGALSQGQEMVLAVARAFLHRELDDHSFAVIAYSEGLLDYQFRAALWRLINDHFRGMPTSTLKTLVIVIESPIDIDLHCGTASGFRFAMDQERLLIRQGEADLTVQAGVVAKHEGPLVFFLGAGFAASSRMPLGNTMRDGAIRGLLSIPVDEPLTSMELAERFYEWVADRGWLTNLERELARDWYIAHLTLEQVVRAERRAASGESSTLSEFAVHHNRVIDAPGQAVRDLCAVLGSNRLRPLLVTTNFDTLVERHCDAPLKVFFSNDHFGDACRHIEAYVEGVTEEIPLLKLHGSIQDPNSCVVSTSQTEGGLGSAKLQALHCLRDSDSPVWWIYVGTSMRDLDLQPILRAEDFAGGVDERWVEPYLSRGVDESPAREPPFGREQIVHRSRTG